MEGNRREANGCSVCVDVPGEPTQGAAVQNLGKGSLSLCGKCRDQNNDHQSSKSLLEEKINDKTSVDAAEGMFSRVPFAAGGNNGGNNAGLGLPSPWACAPNPEFAIHDEYRDFLVKLIVDLLVTKFRVVPHKVFTLKLVKQTADNIFGNLIWIEPWGRGHSHQTRSASQSNCYFDWRWAA